MLPGGGGTPFGQSSYYNLHPAMDYYIIGSTLSDLLLISFFRYVCMYKSNEYCRFPLLSNFFVCSGVAIQMRFPLYSCPSLSGVLPHLLFLQNLPSVVVGHVLGPCPGESILDMCAAPGLSSVTAIWHCRKICEDDLKHFQEDSGL